MGAQGRPLGWRTALRRPVLLSVALVAVLTLVVTVSAVGEGWWRSGGSGEGAPTDTPSGAETDVASPAPSEGLRRSVPVRLTIPAVEVDAPVSALGLENGELAPLPDPAAVGWPEEGTSPGEPGSAALLGSVDTGESSDDSDDSEGSEDSTDAEDAEDAGSGEPGAFARVHQLDAGDRIDVWREDGEAASFEVVEVRPHAAGEPPAAPVGRPRLRLVGVPGGVPAEEDGQEDGSDTEDSEDADQDAEDEDADTDEGSGEAVVVTAVFLPDAER